MANLNTTYLGLDLKNPLIASASPFSKSLSSAKRLEDAGVSAIVMYSLFQEQVEYNNKRLNYFLTRYTDQYAEALTYFPDLDDYNVGVDGYLKDVRTLKENLHIPIIGSLNGIKFGDWVEYAAQIEQAGADALELNYYYVPTDPTDSSQFIEKEVVELVSAVAHQVNIPVDIKLSPFFTALPNLVNRVVKAGVEGLTLFNRFMQPDLDVEALEVEVFAHLSTSDEMLLPLRWMALLYGRYDVDLALTTGVHSGRDIVKAIMAGAKVVMSASAFISKGAEQAKVMLDEMNKWMDRFGYDSVDEMRGSLSQLRVEASSAFERAQYMEALKVFDHRLP